MIPEDVVYTFDDLKREYESYIIWPSDRKTIEEAYEFARKKHEGQFRRHGQA